MLLSVGCQSEGPESRAVDYYNEGVDLFSEGKLGLAEQQYKLAIDADASLAEAHLNLGVVYLQTGWLDGAEQSTLTALDHLSSSGRTVITGSTVEETKSLAYLNLCAIEIQRGLGAELELDYDAGRMHWERTMANLRQAVELDPSNAVAQSLIAQLEDAY